MRILLVSNGYPPTAYGGVEIYTHGLATALAAEDHEVSVFCRESDHQLPDYEVIDGEQHGITILRVVNDFKSIRNFEQTYRDERIEALFDGVLDRVKPDLVHFNHLIALSVGLPAVATRHNMPHLTTLHDFWYLCQRVHLQDWRARRCPGPHQGGDCYRCVVTSTLWIKLRRRLLRWGRNVLGSRDRRRIRDWGWLPSSTSVIGLTARPQDFHLRWERFSGALRLSRQVLAPSEFVRRIFYQNGFRDLAIEVLPLGIRIPPSAGLSPEFPERITFGFIGTLAPAKGAHILIKAFRRVQSAHVRLAIYGRQDADPAYTRLLTKLAKGDERITFKGPFPIQDRDEVYRRLDALVIPSIAQETFSMVAHEGLVSGTPIIASRAGALAETVTEGVNGFLVPPGDADRLASCIAALAAEPNRLAALDVPGPLPSLTVGEHVDRLLKRYREISNVHE